VKGNSLTLPQCNSSFRTSEGCRSPTFLISDLGIAHLPLIFRLISLDIAFRAVEKRGPAASVLLKGCNRKKGVMSQTTTVTPMLRATLGALCYPASVLPGIGSRP
jgi:hypothetical protein